MNKEISTGPQALPPIESRFEKINRQDAEGLLWGMDDALDATLKY